MGTDSANLYRKVRHSTARLGAFAVAVAIGIAVASLVPKLSDAVRTALGLVSGTSVAVLSGQEAEGDAGKQKPEASGNELPAVVKLTDDQFGTAGIELAPVQDGTPTHQIIVPGTIVPHADRIARVSVRLPAMVAELRNMLCCAERKQLRSVGKGAHFAPCPRAAEVQRWVRFALPPCALP